MAQQLDEDTRDPTYRTRTMTIYLDNAATSHPKPEAVYAQARRALEEIGASPGRGSYRLAQAASTVMAEARRSLATLFGISNPADLAFTTNATESINVVLKGWLRPGDRVLISSLEHNAVVRPLARLAQSGVQVERIGSSPSGELDLDHLQRLLTPPPRLVAVVHACNVNGALQPVAEVASRCDRAGAPLLLDAAQTAGIVPVDAELWNLGMLACSGHKGLLGPAGVGVLYIRPDLDVAPLKEGGTGSHSEEDQQPHLRPDRYESGTLNLPGIAGLAAGVAFILEQGIEDIGGHERQLAARLEDGLEDIGGLQVYRPAVRGTGAVSFNAHRLNPADVGALLDTGFDIAVRTGLHCAPLAHQTLGSFPEGSVRVSPGFFTTQDQIDQFLMAMRALMSRIRR